jgi:hypothetical protein
LGFNVFGGEEDQGWLIMKGSNVNIGRFQGMFDKNILTFNLGGDENAAALDAFTDIREIQKRLRANGIEFVSEADENSTGPANFSIIDPDGNPILIDQHV